MSLVMSAPGCGALDNGTTPFESSTVGNNEVAAIASTGLMSQKPSTPEKKKRSSLMRSLGSTTMKAGAANISPVSMESPLLVSSNRFTFDIDDLHRDTDKLTRSARKRLGRRHGSARREAAYVTQEDSKDSNSVSNSSIESHYGIHARSTSGSFRSAAGGGGGGCGMSTTSTGSSGTDSNRFSPSVSGPSSPAKSKSFLSKIVRWHRGKKVGKLRDHLESLFPKLKTTEDEVNHWLDTVCDQRESVWQNGQRMLSQIQMHINSYTKQLDFLEDSMNDIRQLDYDVLKEIEELRIAFAFNQELLHKGGRHHSNGKLTESDIRLNLEMTLEDAKGQDMLRLAPPSGVAALVLGSGRTAAHGVYLHPPGSPNSSLPLSPTAESVSSHGAAEKSVALISVSASAEGITKSPRSSTLSSGETHFQHKTELHWDGSDYKRRCLKSSSISLQQLQLSNSPAGPSGVAIDPLKKQGSVECKGEKKNRRFSGKFIKGLGDKIQNVAHIKSAVSSPDVPSSDRNSMTPPPSLRADGSAYSVDTSVAPAAGVEHAASTKGNNSSHKTRVRSLSCGVAVIVEDDGQEQQQQQQQLLKRRRASTSTPRKATCDRLSYLLETFTTEEVTADDLTDPDQKEMVQRMNRCLSLKDTLKTLLYTIENTQEEEMVNMRKMKKLRNELQNVMDGAPRWVQLRHSNSLPTNHHPPLHHHQHHPPFALHGSTSLKDFGAFSASDSDVRSCHSKSGFYIHAHEGSICSSLCSFDHADTPGGTHSPENLHVSHSPINNSHKCATCDPDPSIGHVDDRVVAAAVAAGAAAAATQPCCCDASACDKTDVTCTTSESLLTTNGACGVHSVAVDGPITEPEPAPPQSPCTSCCSAFTSMESLSRSGSGCGMPRPRPISVQSQTKLGIAELKQEDAGIETDPVAASPTVATVSEDVHESKKAGSCCNCKDKTSQQEPEARVAEGTPGDSAAPIADAKSMPQTDSNTCKSGAALDKLSLTVAEELETAVSEVVGDLRALLKEEKLARANLERIHFMLENAHHVHTQLDVVCSNN